MTYYTISIGMMVLLEKLTASERAVFLLKEVFSYDYREISEIIEKSEDNCRQVFSRAKKHLGGREKRFKVDIQVHEKLLQQFLSAVNKGNMEGLLSLLKSDVELIADGGGKSFSFGGQRFSDTRQPSLGQHDVSKFVFNVGEKIRKHVPNLSHKVVFANGLPSVVTYSNNVPYCIMSLKLMRIKFRHLFTTNRTKSGIFKYLGYAENRLTNNVKIQILQVKTEISNFSCSGFKLSLVTLNPHK